MDASMNDLLNQEIMDLAITSPIYSKAMDTVLNRLDAAVEGYYTTDHERDQLDWTRPFEYNIGLIAGMRLQGKIYESEKK